MLTPKKINKLISNEQNNMVQHTFTQCIAQPEFEPGRYHYQASTLTTAPSQLVRISDRLVNIMHALISQSKMEPYSQIFIIKRDKNLGTKILDLGDPSLPPSLIIIILKMFNCHPSSPPLHRITF